MASSAEKVVTSAQTMTSKGFGRFKAALSDNLTEDIILQLATYFDYPPAQIDLLQNKDSRNHLMVRYMEERGQISKTDITTLLRALKARKLHGIHERVQELFELHTGKQCTSDDQSMLQPEDLNFGKLDLRPKQSFPPDHTRRKLESFTSADRQNIILENGKIVPVLPALEELQIKTNKGKEFSQEQVIGLFCYAEQCQRLKKVSFIDCVLPLSLPVGSLSPLTKLHDIEVSWKPSKPDLHLDSSRGKWVLNSKEGVTLEVSL
ncbi:hypothetical protein BSL78_28302 [Apostichopus japonicus]|uniref:Uncharacterized protein n=1 Tax=Stichopus japonicus TaxID=307972 RepID=A0A2G8JGJ4_STIJA|nr:hypothetical protein BSL78_28302 [Apostichopus japonicus]